ncbi:MAG: hypothetical protein ABIM60_04800 [candidate division WOR-3 bacterium]
MRRWFSYRIKSLLVSISTDDKKINKIVEDSVVVFTLNHRGDEIAYVKGLIDCMCEDPVCRLNDEDKIIFINTLTGNIIKEFDPVCPFVWDLEFTHDDNFLIFLGYGDTALRGFYRLNLKTLKETLLFTTDKEYTFTLHPENDSIIYGDSIWYPEFNPQNNFEFVFSNIYNASEWLSGDERFTVCDLYLFNLKENKKTPLNAKPYYYTSFGRISFSPDGKRIIFSAARPFIWEMIQFDDQELWILNLK